MAKQELVIKKKKTVVSVYRGKDRLISGKDVIRLKDNLIAILFHSYCEVYTYKNSWLTSVARYDASYFPFLNRIYQ